MSAKAVSRNPAATLAAGAAVLAIALGIRHSFGLFLQPISSAAGWGREVFAFAMALQNLVWGAAQPFTGRLADRYGAGPVVAGGALLYVLGLIAMALPQGEASFVLSTGLLIGLGLSGTTFPVIFGAVTRATAPERHSLVMGIAMAVGSFGQFVMLPTALTGLAWLDWPRTLIAMSFLAASMIPLALPLFEQREPGVAVAHAGAASAVREALACRDFWLLSLGFFVCGFQLVFIATHIPAFLADQGLGSGVGTMVLALVGLFNIAGTYTAGLWGGRRRKPMLLSWIYLGRAVLIAGFVLLPVSAGSALLFGALMGLFWLSTVPLTNGTVATLFGVRNLSMLGGIVFFAHQVGGFLGGWLGGVLYDRFGSYSIAWLVAITLSLVATLLNLPIRERPRPPLPAAAPA